MHGQKNIKLYKSGV